MTSDQPTTTLTPGTFTVSVEALRAEISRLQKDREFWKREATIERQLAATLRKELDITRHRLARREIPHG